MGVGPRGSAFRAPRAGAATPDPSAKVSSAVTRQLGCPRPSRGVPASALCPLALAASSGSCRGVTQVTRCGYRRGLGWGGWHGGVGSSVSQEWGPGAPAAMRYPPRECGLAAPPSESQGPELLGAPSKPVVLLPAGHPPSHR